MTLSIIARDPDAGVVGAAVTSCAIAAARRILHVRPGVGAVVAQGSSEITWGDAILDLLERGTSPADAIKAVSFDETTQVAALAFDGELAVHTGSHCDPHAGHATGVGVSVQVNTAARPDAADRMLAAFAGARSPLAERLVAALAASGGDARGQQGAGVIVTGQTPLRGYEDEPHVDLRVDDHRDPVAELGRLLELHRAHCTMRSIRNSPPDDQLPVLAELLGRHPGDPHLRRAVQRARRPSTGRLEPPGR